MLTLPQVYKRFLNRYGPQHWWPAETPFEVMVGAVLTQNTSWTNVERAIVNLKQSGALDPDTIVRAEHAKLADWLRPSGYFNIKAKRLRNYCAWYLEQGGFEELDRLETHALRHAVLSVNGVGYETADDILLYAFQRPVFVIDAYTRRLYSRLGLIQGDEGYEQLRHFSETGLGRVKDKVPVYNEFHALIVRHAKEHCHKRPECSGCCVGKFCPATEA